MNNAVALAVKITADGNAAAAGIGQVTDKTSKLQTAGKLAGRALAAGLGVAVVAGAAAVKAAAADEAAQAKLAGAIKNATGARAGDVASVEAWVTAQGKALGVADDELRPALEQLVTATNDVSKAQDLAAIAMDISARKGVSLESVSKTLAKAQATGNVAALAKYGVATKDAAGKQKSLEDVTKSLADTYRGSAAAAADTAAGKQKRLSVAVDELKEKYGVKLIPVLLSAAAAGMAVVNWIDQNETAAAAIVLTLASLLAIVKAVSIATQVWSAITKAAAAAQAVFNAVMAANPVILIVLAVVALAAALVIAYKRSETFRNIVNGVFGAIADTVGKVVGFIRNNWQTMLVILTGPIGLAVALIAKHWDKIKAGGVAIVTWVNNTWSNLKQKLAGPVEDAKALIETALGAVQGAFDKVAGAVQTIIDKVVALIKKIGELPGTGVLGQVVGAVTRGGGSPVAGGTGITRGGGGDTYVTVHVPGGFIGDEQQLAVKLARILDDQARR